MTGCTIQCATATCYRTNYYKYQAPKAGSSLLFLRPVRTHKVSSPISASHSMTSSHQQVQAPADLQCSCIMFYWSFGPLVLFGLPPQFSCILQQLRPNYSHASDSYCDFDWFCQ